MTQQEELPTGWDKLPLSQIADRIIVGLAMGITQHYADDGVVLLRNQNIRPDRFDGSDTLFLTNEFAATQKSKRLRAGDVLTVRTGANIGDTCVVPDEYAGSLTFTTLITSPNATKLDPRFLSYYINSSFGRSEVNRLMAGGGKGNLNSTELKKFVLVSPPLAEQQRISTILATWDQSIELTKNLIAAKQRLKTALIQQLLTGKLRLPGFTEKWNSTQIERFLTESRISGSAGDSAQKLTVKLYGKGVIPKADLRPGSAETKYYRRRAGQFIYSKLDFLNGAFGLIPAELDGYESTLDLPAFDVGADADPRWLLHFVSRESFYKTGLSLANGGRKARRVNPVDFLKSEIPFPRRQEQQAIADVIETAVQEIRLHQRKLDALRRQKKGLMQQLLTGKVRVNVTGASGG